MNTVTLLFKTMVINKLKYILIILLHVHRTCMKNGIQAGIHIITIV